MSGGDDCGACINITIMINNTLDSTSFDLLSTVEQGGCSAKISAAELSQLLSDIPMLSNENVLVDIENHDDAGVYRISDTMALIVTTDFFPPVCSDAFEFGEIAAANSLSDVYAMGGVPLLVLNLNMFPSKSAPLVVLRDILRGGQSKINEARALTMGGHTIEDCTPKYGLAVVGTVDPQRVITNTGAVVGQKLILTKPLGSGTLIAAQRMGMADHEAYRAAIDGMKLLNDQGAEVMQRYGVRGATDVTGFGLLGHLSKMAYGSGVCMRVNSSLLPVLPQVMELLDDGCIPGSAFKNLDFVRDGVIFEPSVSLAAKMVCCDAQTSGGLLMCVDADVAEQALAELRGGKYPYSAIIGEVTAGMAGVVVF